MKKLLAFAVLFSVFSTVASAQTKAQLTTKISTPTVQCELCKKRIEEGLKRYDGVLSVNVNYKKKETTVKYLTDRTNEEVIKTAIANLGYDANEVTATKEVYDALPKCCKKPDDGGGKKQ